MKLNTKNDPIFAHCKRISHREDLKFYLTIARRHIAQCLMPETYTAVVGEMTALLAEYEDVDGTAARKKKVQRLAMRLRVSVPGGSHFICRPFRHSSRLRTLLHRAQAHGVSEEHARPRLVELLSLQAQDDARVLPRPLALTTEEVETIVQSVTPAVATAATPARKAPTNWKARALAAEARVSELGRLPVKKLRVVKTSGQPVSETRSEASKRAWVTIRRNRALKAVAS